MIRNESGPQVGLIKRLILAAILGACCQLDLAAQDAESADLRRVPVAEALVAAPGLESPDLDGSAAPGTADFDDLDAHAVEKRLSALETSFRKRSSAVRVVPWR